MAAWRCIAGWDDRMPEIEPETPRTAQTPGAAQSLKPWQLPLLAVGVMFACLAILWPFASVIAWAVIIAYVTWPLYGVLRRPFGKFQSARAITMTVVVMVAVIVPALWFFASIAGELLSAYRSIAALLADKPLVLHELVGRIPWLGAHLQQQLDGMSAEPAGFATQVGAWAQAWSARIATLAGGVGRGIGKLVLVMFTLFFLYRDGDSIVTRIRQAVSATFGNRLDTYVRGAGSMTRAVLFGFLVTAFAQGLIAGIGYAILGIHGSVLLGAVTGILSFIPLLGTAVVWGSLGAYLLLTGHIAKGVILLLWGFLLVHPADNVLRPLLISSATQVPFVVVMFGVLGGIATCGLVGLFVGPVVLAVGFSIMRDMGRGREGEGRAASGQM